MSEPVTGALHITGVKKVFPSGAEDLVVFEDVSFTVAKGSTAVILGESGSGKTTLLNLIGTLDSCTAGRIVFNGFDITEQPEENLVEFRSRQLGFIFQFHYLLKDLTALENVLIPALIVRSARAPALERARQLLSQVGLSARMSHYPVQLSGGERQRVAVARALVLAPRLILADEPTGQLDSTSAAEVADLLVELAAESGGMLVVVTHDESLAAAVGGIRQLVDGRLLP